MPPNTQLPEDCPAWLAQWIGKNDERLRNIEKTLKTLAHDNPRGKITFKWVVEKLAVPGMFLLAGYLIARGG